ncbi:hypothetical protein [Cupriavidus necator]|uniref:hypothetical protein n=1 Tax=Cupriavidus necator TaxID=106590 RepID=UPI000AD90503|nr:hypothetical protein [Cupriavidus necator]
MNPEPSANFDHFDLSRATPGLTKPAASPNLTHMDRRHLDLAQIIRTIPRMVG